MKKHQNQISQMNRGDVDKMTVSVVMPVYNVERYVDECLQSVLDQTYKHMEVIVVDDCGTDQSMAVVEQCLSRNRYEKCADAEVYASTTAGKTVKILHHNHNRGLSAARNTGIDVATGEYVYFIDSDDTITPNCIELLVEQAERHPGVDMVQGGIWSDDPEMNRYVHRPSDVWHVGAISVGEKACRKLLLKGCMCAMACNRMVKLDLICENNLYFKEGIIHEDELWTYMLGNCVSSIAFHSGETYFYRHNESGIMSETKSERSAKDYCFIADYILSHLPAFKGYMLGVIYAMRTVMLVSSDSGVAPMRQMRYGKDLFVRLMFKHWNDVRWKKAAIALPCAVGFWFTRFLVRE